MSPRLLQRKIQRRARQGLQRRAKEEPSTSSVLETAGQGVVAGRSAEGLLDQVPAGGGGAGIQRRVVQRELGLGRSAGVDEQLSEKVAKANPVANVDKNAPNSPLSHPYFPTFKARVLALFAHVGAPKSKDPAALAEELWQGVCGAISQSQGQMADENTYQNKDKAKGWVDMSSAAFQAAIATFEKTLATLQQYTQSQFAKCNTFGFWSTPTGKELAEHHCDVTLETSGVGALFDGMAA